MQQNAVRNALRKGALALLVMMSLPQRAVAQATIETDSTSMPAETMHPGHPALDASTEVSLLGVSGGFAVATHIVPESVRPIPNPGFDPVDITWSVDRNALGPHDAAADRLSDLTRDASVLLPVALALVTTRGSDRWSDLAATGVVYTEALLISGTVTHFGKVVFGRPRPGAYLPVETEPRPASAGTFHSMPSSHSSMAWTGASVAFTQHLLRRPDAGWAERIGVGLVSGAFASVTSALRVEAGAHFPSDVIAGAGIGMTTGVTVPLLHRGAQSLPPRSAWLQTLGGVVAGAFIGVAIAGS